MAKTVRSRKAKGRRLQNYVKEKLLQVFHFLHEDDIKPAIMGEGGTDLKLSPAARIHIPYSIECKNHEKISIWAALKQSEENVVEGTHPAVIFQRNRSDVYVTLKFDHFVELIANQSKLSDTNTLT